MLTCTGHIKSKEDFWNTAQKYKYWRGDFITVLDTAKDIVNLHVHIKWIIIFSNLFKKNKCTQATTFDFALSEIYLFLLGMIVSIAIADMTTYTFVT